MAAILRVKRKKEEEPSDALLIACKRPKVECDETSLHPLTALVKFAGTVEKHEDCLVKHITKLLSKDELKENYKQHIVDITKKARLETKEHSNANRYKIVNSTRSLDTSQIKDLEEDVINIVDIEDTKATSEKKNDDGYVYDLYYTPTKEVIEIENLLSVLPVPEDLVFENYDDDKDARYDNESEDSNSESNWKNDYPDSDHSDDETLIKNAMKNLNVEDELSSDSDNFVYGLEEEDVKKHGYKYAQYKARMLKEKEKFEDTGVIDSEESYESNECNETEEDAESDNDLEGFDGYYNDEE